MELSQHRNDDNSVLKSPKPILKWAGGKGQLLAELVCRIPKSFNKYIEPFFGGGALFFHYKAENSIVSDSSPELINLYSMVAEKTELVIESLKNYENNEEMFYSVRKQDGTKFHFSENLL
jgi:DNA adenine methylase